MAVCIAQAQHDGKEGVGVGAQHDVGGGGGGGVVGEGEEGGGGGGGKEVR